MTSDIYLKAKKAADKSGIAEIATVDDYGMPHIKAMMIAKRDRLKTFYFCSNVSSKRYRQIEKNPKSCLYFCDKDTFEGVCLYGEAKVTTDKKILSELWEDGMEKYYPDGVEDEDYCVIIFNSKYGNYYRGLKNTDFDIISEGEIDAN